ncbi:MAG: Tex family protein [Bdellovibrionota bacterium]
MTFENWFSEQEPKISIPSAEAVLRLVGEGGTVPFIARYRKEQTGNLDEVGIQAVIDAKEKWESIVKRQTHIIGEIEHQKKLTPELKEKILSTFQLELLEDIYLPYKVKRKTKAALAKEAGLEPLADWIWNCGHGTEQPQPGQTLELWAFTFRNEEKDIKDAEAAIAGAQAILIERLSETQHLRQLVRTKTFEEGFVRTTKGTKAKPHSKFEDYFEYSESIQSLLKPENSHRYLAVRRGWMTEELILSIGGKPGEEEPFEEYLLRSFETEACTVLTSPGAAVLKKAARLALKAHVQSSIENEAHQALREVADEAAIKVFAENVRKLLLSSPFGPKAVLGVDPGLRTGCKLAVVDDSGKYIASTVMHLQTDEGKSRARSLLSEVVKNGNIRAIAVGNGTAGRETETFVRKALKDLDLSSIPVVMVSESGASVYSASEVAREEFPDLDVTVRGAISIARRLQDPLAELVKIDPKSIGVGQYQHDVSEHRLKKSLDLVVDSCVNQVGVNINTASYHLLSHVAGIGPSLAKSIVEYRGQKGLFKSRETLLEVPRLSKKAFEQAAGFLRIPESDNPLDNTGVHPEQYGLLETRAKALGKTLRDLMGSGVLALKKDAEFKKEIGSFTFEDIIKELEKPGRDPREEFVPFQYREDVHQVSDLKPGMLCPGIVTNVTNFGAFVDIGVHQDGLVHLSQLANHFVKDPKEVVSPGDRVNVRILEVNLDKNQISLTMKSAQEAVRNQSRPAVKQVALQNKPGNRPSPGQHRPSPAKPKSVFNNAFAGLAGLRSQLKPDKK